LIRILTNHGETFVFEVVLMIIVWSVETHLRWHSASPYLLDNVIAQAYNRVAV